MIKKAILCIMLIITVVAGTVVFAEGNLVNFRQQKTYSATTFHDVNASDWYYGAIKVAYELGLMDGKAQGFFDPKGNLTLAEAVAIASRVHNVYNGGDGVIVNDGPNWYDGTVSYAIKNSIIKNTDFIDYTKLATRAQMAYIFASTLQSSDYTAINNITKLPDVTSSTLYSDHIFKLYNAGIIGGSDKMGTFKPSSNITRAETVAILKNLVVKSDRKVLSLETTTTQGANLAPDYYNTIIAGDLGNSYIIKSDNTLWSWGYLNDLGELGNGTIGIEGDKKFGLSPVKIMSDVLSIHTNENAYSKKTFMAIKTDGSLWGWGGNDLGQLGDAPQINSKPIKIMDSVRSVYMDDGYTCVIKKDGSLWTIGTIFSEVGASGKPEKIMTSVESVATGTSYIMAIKTDRSLWALGENVGGRLGDGTSESRTKPVKIMDNVASVESGGFFTMAIKTDKSLWGWGYNELGQLGDGTTEARLKPIKIMDSVSSVYPIRHWAKPYTMAIKTDGSLWGWGFNRHYNLGNGTNVDQIRPVKIMSDGVSSVVIPMLKEMSDNPSLILKTDGSLWTWRGNTGLDSPDRYEYATKPYKVMDSIANVSAGDSHVMAVDKDGSLWSWGVLCFNESAVRQPMPPFSRDSKSKFYNHNYYEFLSYLRIDRGFFLHFLPPISHTAKRYGSDLVEKANEITSGLTNDYDKAKAIFDWINSEDARTGKFASHLEDEGAMGGFIGTGNGKSKFMTILLNAIGIAAIDSPSNAGQDGMYASCEALINGRWIIIGMQDAPRGGFDVSIEEFSKYNKYLIVSSTDQMNNASIPMRIFENVNVLLYKK